MNRRVSRRTLLSSFAAGGASCLLPGGNAGATSEAAESSQSDGEGASLGIAWTDTTESGKGGRVFDTVQTAGGYLLGGVIHTGLDDAQNDGFLRRIGLNGVESWETRFQRDGGWAIDAVTAVTGGYVAAANRDDGAGVALLWYDLFGDLVREERIGQNKNDRLEDLVTIDGEVVAVGRRDTGDHASDTWLVRYSADGDNLLEKTYYSDIEQARFHNVVPASGSDLWVIATIKHEAGTDYRVSITKLAEDGSMRFGKELALNDNDDFVWGTIPLSGGRFFASGRNRVPGSNWTAWAGKFDESGESEWIWRNDGAEWNESTDCLQLHDGSFLVVGENTRGRSAWAANLDRDGNERWSETYSTAETEEFTCVVQAPGGAMAAGRSWDKGQRGWPTPWMARLSVLGDTDDIGFDPRVHGFGFSNWGGSSGFAADGSEFDFSYEHIDEEDAKDAIVGLATPLQNYDRLWDGGSSILKSMYTEYSSQGGHCLGMVHAADHYYRSPGDLPSAAATASDVPHPTGTYRPAGDLIREKQSIFSHGLDPALQSLRESTPTFDVDENHEKILESIDRTDAAPIKLLLSDSDSNHAVLAYDYEPDGETVDLYVYDPGDTAERYLSLDKRAGTELDKPDSDQNRAFEDPLNVLTIDAEDGSLVSSTYDLDGYHYIPLDRAVGGGSDENREQTKAVVDTLRMPAPESNADPKEVTPDAMPAMAVTLESATELSVTGPGGRDVETFDSSEHPAVDSGERIAWDIGRDPGEYTIEVGSEVATDYSLDVNGMDPEGGSVSTTVEESIDEGKRHEVNATLPETGAGEVEVVKRQRDEGEETDTGQPNEHSTGTESGRPEDDFSGRNATATPTGGDDGWSSKELAAVAGLLTLASFGYLARSRE